MSGQLLIDTKTFQINISKSQNTCFPTNSIIRIVGKSLIQTRPMEKMCLESDVAATKEHVYFKVRTEQI